MMIKRVHKRMSPLYIMEDGRLICYKYGRLYIIKDNKVESTFSIFKDFKECILARIGLLYRFLRLGIRTIVAIDDNHVVISKGNHLFEVDINTGEKSSGYFCGHGRRPLLFSKIKGIDGFTNGIYYGDYLGVYEETPIYISRRNDKDSWEKVYTFPSGSIEHIHNIIPDPYRQCLWIFTGDFGKAAAIWKVTENFKKVECVACNDQKYRGCVAYAVEEGVIYATDSPFAENYIYLFDTTNHETKPLLPIHGSCIYGTQWNEYQVFSSTVEGDVYKSKNDFFFSRKRGSGIKDEYVHMYLGTLNEGFSEVYKEKKDGYPLYAFQYGVFRFPYGTNLTDTLFFQPISTETNDLCLMSLNK